MVSPSSATLLAPLTYDGADILLRFASQQWKGYRRLLVVARKQDGAGVALGGSVQYLGGGGAPAGIVGCLGVGFEGGLVAVDLVEEEVVRVLLVVQYVEPEAARLVAG